jgi:hypothetical protein
VRESRSLGSVRGAVRKDGPYRDYMRGLYQQLHVTRNCETAELTILDNCGDLSILRGAPNRHAPRWTGRLD